jgi:hypothetical protein
MGRERDELISSNYREAAWFESLPGSLRTYLAKLGTTKENFQL